MAVTHKFVSAKTDGADATLVQPGDWNDDHIYDYAVTLGGYAVLTNIGTAYDGTSALKGLGHCYLDLNGIDTIIWTLKYNKITANAFDFQLWNETDGAQIGIFNDTGAINNYKTLTQTISAVALTGLKVIRVRAKGATATDDPEYYGSSLLLRNTS